MIVKKVKRLCRRLLGIAPTGIEKCNNITAPPPAYEGGSWVETTVTVDQARIEEALQAFPLEQKRLLHVGVGSSNIAKRFGGEATPVDGITVIAEEKAHAESLDLQNYNAIILNKYNDAEMKSIKQSYDFIIDNNLSSFACCKYHYRSMLENYIDILNPDGKILTDITGMSFCEDYAFPITIDDLKALEHEFPVRILSLSESVFAIEKTG